MPQIMAKYFTQHPNVQITMPVENTKQLLQRLNNGEIEFAIIEGYFDKHVYGHAAVL